MISRQTVHARWESEVDQLRAYWEDIGTLVYTDKDVSLETDIACEAAQILRCFL